MNGEAVAAPGPVTGEVVFNTAMSGYQEAVTDPSYAGQILTFTYPHVGNYGASGKAMESDRAHARAVIMRAAVNAEDASGAERGSLDWLEDCGVPAITGVDTRALVRHLRDRGAMRGGLFAAEVPEAEALERVRAEPPMAGQDLARSCLRTASSRSVTATGRGSRRWTRASSCRSCATWSRAGPGSRCTRARRGRGVPGRRPRRDLPGQRARRPSGAGLHRRDRPRARRAAAGVGHLPRPPAAVPGGRPGHLQAPVRAPRRQPPGQGPRDRAHRDHVAEPRVRRPRPRRQAAHRGRRARALGDQFGAGP